MDIVYHDQIKRDLRAASAYYDAEGGSRLGDRFFEAVRVKMRLYKLMEMASALIQFPTNMSSSPFLLTTIAICLSGLLQAGEPVKVEMLIMAIGDPGGGKLQSNSIGCAVVHFRNRTTP